MRRATLSGVPALALALVMSVATARAATSIHPDTTPGLGLGTTVTVKGSVYTINNGTRVGSNLFESFSSRVTGGSPSQISGTLDSTALPGAAFYFINPAGIVFGAGAAVKVPGAAHFSTARQLVFADGAVFTATTATGSALTMAPPSAFGFLGGEGDIVLDGVGRGFVCRSPPPIWPSRPPASWPATST
jgi:filamentous hemagglutinin family protein